MNMIFYRYGSICEPDFIAAFEKTGLSVIEITREITQKQISMEERIADIVSAIKSNQFLFMFSVNFFPYISDICERYQVPYVCWSVDNPVIELHDKALKNSCNRIFLFDRAQYDLFVQYNPTGVFYLPLATNVARWDKVRSTITESDKKAFANPLSFVGSLYERNQPLDEVTLSDFGTGYVEGIIKAQKDIYGYNFLEQVLQDEVMTELKEKSEFWNELNRMIQIDSNQDLVEKNIVADHFLARKIANMERVETLNKLAMCMPTTLFTHSDTGQLENVIVKSGVQTLTEMPKVFALSDINLNITLKSIRTGLPLRIWDILGCGGFAMSNFQTELMEYFELGSDIEAYSSLEELQEKVEFYTEHEEIRKKIALNGYEKVKQYHTYDQRIVTLMKQLMETIS